MSPPKKKRTTATCSTFAVWRPSDLPHVSGARWLSFCSWQRWGALEVAIGVGGSSRGTWINPNQKNPRNSSSATCHGFFGESNPFWPGFSNFERFFSGFFFSKGGDFCFGNHKSQRIFRFSIHMHRKFRGKVSKVAFDIFLELQPTSFFNECFVKQQFPG